MDDRSDSSSFEELNAPDHAEDVAAAAASSEQPDSEWLDVLGSGALLKKIIKKGTSDDDKPKRGDICTVNIVGRLEDGTIIEQNDMFEMQLGDGDVIQGVDLIVALMELGEMCQIKLTSRFGYGDVGMLPKVPPFANLVYDIELVDFQPEPDIETLDIAERKATGIKKRVRGNWWYSMGEPVTAIQCYKKSLEYLDEVSGGITDPTPDGNLEETSSELHSLLDERIITYNNMAAAQLKQGSLDAALNSVEIVLTCQPDNVKALFRKGKIMALKNNISDAVKCIKRALTLSSDDKVIKAELHRLETREKNENMKERDLARKMLGNTSDRSSKKDESDKDRQKKDKGKKVLMWGTIIFSIAIGVISFALYKYKII